MKITTHSFVNSMLSRLEKLYRKLPNLPENMRLAFVRITAWFALIVGILITLGALTTLGMVPLALSSNLGLRGIVIALLFIIVSLAALTSSLMLLAAFPKLRKYKMAGWHLLALSMVIGAVSMLLFFSLRSFLMYAVGMYIVFQIKPYYK